MFQAFVIVLREGFEAFLIISIIFTYLTRMQQRSLLPAVWWGVGVSLVASAAFGFALEKGANEPLWEGILGFVAVIFVTSLVIQMWTQGRHMKSQMEAKMGEITAKKTGRMAWWGVFIFTVFMIAREGMETALMLIQVPQKEVFLGVLLGVLATAGFSVMWAKFSRLINVKLFFQVTGIFLLLFVAQILIYSLHEFSEAGILPNSEAFHQASEIYSPDGLYGKWFSVVIIGACALWLAAAWVRNKFFSAEKKAV